MTTPAQRRIAPVLSDIHRRWGPAALRSAAELTSNQVTIATGFAALDELLGGGIPCGAVTAIRGCHGSGTRSLALAIAAQAHGGAELVAYVDCAATFDAEYALVRGIDPAHLLVVQPADAREALASIEALVVSGDVRAVVIDDLTALVATPRAARSFDAAITRWTPHLSRSGCALIGLLDTHAPHAGAVGPGSAFGHAATLCLHIERYGWLEQPGLFTSIGQLHGTVSLATVVRRDGHAVQRSAALAFSVAP